jgi:SAM-dependent methyltransferase
MTSPTNPCAKPIDNELLADVSAYYTGKLKEYGACPRGVDWNGPESQLLRFRQLVRIVNEHRPVSVNDLGCGYGAFFDFLKETLHNFSYLGCDVSAEMISAARQRHSGDANAQYHIGTVPTRRADYGVASGIFSVRLTHDNTEWREYMNAILDVLNRTSRLGFAFNCLSTYSDPEKARPDLFYADPRDIFDYCTRSFSRNVALLHDYGLYEFTILVRKTS